MARWPAASASSLSNGRVSADRVGHIRDEFFGPTTNIPKALLPLLGRKRGIRKDPIPARTRTLMMPAMNRQ